MFSREVSVLQLIKGPFIFVFLFTIKCDGFPDPFPFSHYFHFLLIYPPKMELHGRDYTSLSSDISQITDEIEKLLNVLQWVSRKPEKSRYQSPRGIVPQKNTTQNEMYGDYVLYLVWTHFSAFWHRFNLGYFLFSFTLLLTLHIIFTTQKTYSSIVQ